jgi:asparagine N-glycosylation enzyme membrane subunit Stt3
MPGMGELIVMLLILALTGLWIWMLFDCIRHEPEKALWLIVIIIGGIIGALVYLFARRNRRGTVT